MLEQALQHYADHCASCHGSDGGGDTADWSRALSEGSRHARDATQSLSDGELFSIIEHGIRLDRHAGLGHGNARRRARQLGAGALRQRLPTLSADDIERIEALSPKTPAQLKEEEEIRRFLEGDAERNPAPHEGTTGLNSMSSKRFFCYDAGDVSRRTFVKGLALGGAVAGLARGDTARTGHPPAAWTTLSGTDFDLRIGETPMNFTGLRGSRSP